MKPPYTAVIFSSQLTGSELESYGEAAVAMEKLAARQPGYLGFESTREGMNGISVSYWADEAAARAWGQHAEHRAIQEKGRGVWYSSYELRVCEVQRGYSWQKE